MWTAVAMLAAVSWAPGEAGDLSLTNVRTTYGLLGAARPDAKVLPGDKLLVAFEIEGITVDPQGKVLYEIAMEVADSSGKVHFKQTPRKLEANNSLGGTRMPAYASVDIGTEEPPGTYTVKVKVTDRAAKASTSLTQSFEVLPKDFGLVRLKLSSDPEANIPAPVLGEGQSVWINFVAVGFGRNQDSGQPNLSVTLRVLDEEGKPTLSKPFTGRVAKEVPAKVMALPLQFMLDLNRSGNFQVRLDATDEVTGKSATVSFPLNVLKLK
jgi:hypothetical protein